ncbi:hypothetical protein ABIB48_002610 [Arthrobacter sp. UYCu511]|uniref:Eco57I restriction-modification methylase domain-containing protein n=1 Tax=Arthrobacter sp. UYCu511 TaxID=3156337 RepID=UPI003390BD1D
MTIAMLPGLPAELLVTPAEKSYGLEEKKRGAIFTKQPVVDFMLDLIGYTADKPLFEKRLLEPASGGGRFMTTAVARLIKSWKAQTDSTDYRQLLPSLRAVELDTETYLAFKESLGGLLVSQGFNAVEVSELVAAWLIHDDYLLTDLEGPFDFVIGNPPYVRQELIDPELLAAYRLQFPTMVGRADLYVPFIERSLDLLGDKGQLSFICSDAWTRNEYGRLLRSKVDAGFHLKYYVDMYGVDAFEVSVGAYTSITVIEKAKQGPTVVAKAEDAGNDYLTELEACLTDSKRQAENPAVRVIDKATKGESPWLLGIGDELKIIHHMERKFKTLADVGCRIGIGVASGTDKVYVVDYATTDVEVGRLLPLATNKDLKDGQLQWKGKGILNPWADTVKPELVDLAEYPKLAAMFEPHREQLMKRYVAKKNPDKWFKTIDRITPSLTWEPKLLIPDIKGNGDAIGYDEGNLYPHHNLYYITSTKWNLRALQALLRSGIAHLFVKAYSVKIGGGYLRFQAQNLKRIRLPEWNDISQDDQAVMVEAGESGETLGHDLLARIYDINESDLTAVL